MAPRKKKLSKEEILQKKREAERKRYQRIKNDPQKREELRKKERLKYLKKKEKGTRKLVVDMTPREHREAKKKWKQECTKYRNKKKNCRNITSSFVRENTPDSDTTSNIQQQIPEISDRIRFDRFDQEIKALKNEVLRYQKRLSRLIMNTKPKDTPNTKLQKMADTPECRKDLVKKALFGEVLKEQLRSNEDRCIHFNIGKIIYGKSKLMVEDTDSDSENEAGPSLASATTKAFNTGDYILVKLLSRNTEYKYVSVIDSIVGEDGEIRVTFLKLCDNEGKIFRVDQDDIADVTMDQVVQKLPNPNIYLKGNRIFYKFDTSVDVFEKQ